VTARGRDGQVQRVLDERRWVRMNVTEKPDVGLKDLAGAVVRIADALDRAVFVLEEMAVRTNIVHPDDVGPSPTAQKVAES
jgi:hypothetical protein